LGDSTATPPAELVHRAQVNPDAWSETLPTISGQMRRVGDWYLTTEDNVATHAVLRIAHTVDGSDPHAASDLTERGIIRVPTTSNDRVTVAVLRAASEGVDGVLVHTSRPGARTLLIDRPVAAGEEVVVAITSAPMDTIGYLGADGTTIPADLIERVSCAGTLDPNAEDAALAAGEVRCSVTSEGLIAVEGEGITAAYVALVGAAFDVRPPGYFAPRTVASRHLRERSVDPRVQASCTYPGPIGGVSCTTSCGTAGRRNCQPNGQWGPCTRAEACNGYDDNCNGQIDETGNALCNDGMSCTVDECRNISVGVRACRNTPAAAVCRRGACTQGLCNGVPDPLSPPGSPSWTSTTYSTGCSWREFDNFCEDNWDSCVCNGRARCEGFNGPQWSGNANDIVGGLAVNQAVLDTSLQSCRDRGPIESLAVGGSLISTASAVRNGGCERTNDPCNIDGICCEPDPASCRTFHEGTSASPGGDLSAPLRPWAVEDLAAVCDNPLASRFSRSLDGSPTYQCATNIAGTLVPPHDSPLRNFCQPDGNPCTAPGRCVWVPGANLYCSPVVWSAGPRDGEIVGGYWDSGWQPLRGAGCSGDPYATGVPGQSSCLRRECNGGGSCVSVASALICNAEAAPSPACGALTCVPPNAAGLPFLYRGAHTGRVIGCRRASGCVPAPIYTAPPSVGFVCLPDDTIFPGQCSECDAAQGDSWSPTPAGGACSATTNPAGLPCNTCSLSGVCAQTATGGACTPF
ncbi:MAG: hypothetical protein ACK6CU_26040, partial [Deltaproteobacteria bacterium]